MAVIVEDLYVDDAVDMLEDMPANVVKRCLLYTSYDLSLVMSGKSFQDIALFVAKRLSPLDDVLSTATHFVLRIASRCDYAIQVRGFL